MKRAFNLIALASMLGGLALSSAWAEQNNSQPGNSPENNSQNSGGANQTTGHHLGRWFNPQSVETIQGQVVQVETTPHGTRHSVHLQVKTESGTLPVFLGPSWFIENQRTQIQPKDEVQVTGSRITVNGEPALVASQVRTHGEILQLREPNGRPVWAAWRPQGQSAPTMGQMGMGPGMMRPGSMEGAMGGGMGEEPGEMHGGGMGRDGMGGGGMGEEPLPGRHMGRGQEGEPMHCMCGRMMAQQREVASALRAMQSKLDRKVDQMNEATGRDKVEAMANVLNELVEQRDKIFNHIIKMQKHMTEHMHGMGGDHQGRGGG